MILDPESYDLWLDPGHGIWRRGEDRAGLDPLSGMTDVGAALSLQCSGHARIARVAVIESLPLRQITHRQALNDCYCP